MAGLFPQIPVSSVLFACTYNMIRSPMACGMLKHLHGHHLFVDSVGVRDGDEVDPFAVVVMDEIGIDISGHHCKTFEELEDTSFDLIISLSPEAQHRAVEMTRTMACEVEFWHTFDPTAVIDAGREAMLESYRQVRDNLMSRIKSRFPPDRAPTV